MSMNTLAELMEDELKDLFSAENQLLKALPKLAKKAEDPKLKNAFTSHLAETEGHVARLETIGTELGIKLTGKKCKAMEGLVEEGKGVLEEVGQSATSLMQPSSARPSASSIMRWRHMAPFARWHKNSATPTSPHFCKPH